MCCKQRRLCLTEKLAKLNADQQKLLNEGLEIIAKCCYRNKFTSKRFPKGISHTLFLYHILRFIFD